MPPNAKVVAPTATTMDLDGRYPRIFIACFPSCVAKGQPTLDYEF